MLAGAGTPEVQAMAAQFQEGGASPLVGLGRTSSADASCWVNGAAVCCLELDEGSKYVRGHPAAHVVPAALAVPNPNENLDNFQAPSSLQTQRFMFRRAGRFN
jgi:2-methylcitrate dehydratase PrpD